MPPLVVGQSNKADCVNSALSYLAAPVVPAVAAVVVAVVLAGDAVRGAVHVQVVAGGEQLAELRGQ